MFDFGAVARMQTAFASGIAASGSPTDFALSTHAYVITDAKGININNYKFINNTADLSGGAIYVRGDSPNCKVRNSYFENNRVNDVQNGQGGAIDWLGENGYIYNSTFKDSFAHTGGTLFVSSNNMNITLSNFTGSRALGEGGVILLLSNNTTITDSIFEFSVALERGGVISAYDAYNATISDCKQLNSSSDIFSLTPAECHKHYFHKYQK